MEWFDPTMLLSTEICELIWSIWPCRSAPLKNRGPDAIFSGFYDGVESLQVLLTRYIYPLLI